MSDVTGKAELLPDWPAQHCRNLQASVDSRPRNQNYEESKHESPLPKEGFLAFWA